MKNEEKSKLDKEIQDIKEEISLLAGWFREAVGSFEKKILTEEKVEKLLMHQIDDLLEAFCRMNKICNQKDWQEQSTLLIELYSIIPEKIRINSFSDLFPFRLLKKKLLKIIIDKWFLSDYSDWSKNIFFFLASRICDNKMPEEEKIVDDLLRLHFKDIAVHIIESWLIIIANSPLLNHKDRLINRLSMARAQSGANYLVFQDMRNAEIVEKLGIEDGDQNLLEAFKNACDLIRSQNRLK